MQCKMADERCNPKRRMQLTSTHPTRCSARLQAISRQSLLPQEPVVHSRRIKDTTAESTRASTAAGWNRAFNKYSPSKEIYLSPIKASEGNLKQVITKLRDKHVDLFTWVINMSEQFHYDNAFLLLSFGKKDVSKMRSMLHRSAIGVDMAFFNNLEEVTLLGQGAFGSVYSCVDPRSQTRFAVKHLSAQYKKYTDHAENLLDYMDERNAIIRAMDNSFVVKFYYSLQIKITGALFLFFELCIGDLINYVDNVSIDDVEEISQKFHDNSAGLIEELYDENLEFLEVGFIYIFEMFCAMDFLVKCNIIHQDIKPDNIMITGTMHLKIGDFGLAYRTRTIHRETNRLLVKVNQIDQSESTNYELAKPGTLYYQDFELQLMNLDAKNPVTFDHIMRNKTIYDTDKISFAEEVLEPTFLTDTWAVGVSSLMLLFRGFQIFDPAHAHENILVDIPRKDVTVFLLNLVGRKSIYTDYIKRGLINAGGVEHRELMTFMASIFTPRLTRCHSYTKEKEIYQFTKVLKMRYIDMDKVERLSTFADRGFNSSTIQMRVIPEVVRTFFESSSKEDYHKFADLLKEIEATRLKKKIPSVVLEMDPGVNINFFN